jgi:hypothetical protein
MHIGEEKQQMKMEVIGTTDKKKARKIDPVIDAIDTTAIGRVSKMTLDHP